MNKTLKFTIDGKEYRLTFNRETVAATENMGLNIRTVYEKPVYSLTLLWRGAFLANHDTLTFAEVDELFNKINKEKLLDALIELYNDPVKSLFDEENSKNLAKWTVT